MSEAETPWKVKLKRFIIGAVVILLFIWAFSTANSAKTRAEKNSETLKTPTYSMSMLLGGPERFAESFGDIDNAEPDKIKTGEYVWQTLRIQNTSSGNASDAEILLNRTIPVEQVLVSSAGYGNEVKVESGEKPNTTLISIDSIEAQEPLYIFLGVNSENLPKSWEGWKEDYKKAVTSIKIEGDDSTATLFGEGYSKTM
mgnify:CR=1 FL=1